MVKTLGKVFIYCDSHQPDSLRKMSNMESFSEDFTNKYTVSKGFRILDLNKIHIQEHQPENLQRGSYICVAVLISERSKDSPIFLPSKCFQPCYVIDTLDYFFIVPELAEGGEQLDKIIEKFLFFGPLPHDTPAKTSFPLHLTRHISSRSLNDIISSAEDLVSVSVSQI